MGEGGFKQNSRRTTKRELIRWRICFSIRTIASPLRFFILFFSSFLHAYILPVARTWQAHTSPNPPLPNTRYIRKVLYVTGWLWKNVEQEKNNKKELLKQKTKLCHWGMCDTFRAISTAGNGESTSSFRNPWKAHRPNNRERQQCMQQTGPCFLRAIFLYIGWWCRR